MRDLNLIIYPTGEKYDCPKSFNAQAVTFPDLQCEMRACNGNKRHLEKVCKSCDYYIINAKEKE